uniref:Uncharacterized protein n=1 Tax=Hyaloperonospora arabidopsidis (strain Emoy2) TaxID=559515 RepID=M4C270_HYAAE
MRWRCLLFLIYAVVDGILFGTAALRRKKTASSAEKGLTTNNPADKPARAEESSRVESESWQDLFLRVESGVVGAAESVERWALYGGEEVRYEPLPTSPTWVDQRFRTPLEWALDGVKDVWLTKYDQGINNVWLDHKVLPETVFDDVHALTSLGLAR